MYSYFLFYFRSLIQLFIRHPNKEDCFSFFKQQNVGGISLLHLFLSFFIFLHTKKNMKVYSTSNFGQTTLKKNFEGKKLKLKNKLRVFI